MLRPVALLALAAALAMPLSSVLAQEKAAPSAAPAKTTQEAGAIDPAAREFIDSFRAAVKNINDITCTVTQTQARGDETVSQAGDLVAVFSRPADGRATLKQFRIASKHDKTDAVWAFDGKTAYKLDNAAKTFASMEAPEGQCFPVGDVAMVVPNWIFGTDILSNKQAKLVGAKFLPDAEVDGVKCRVVEYRVEIPGADEAPTMNMRQVRHVAASDMVARKIETTSTYTGGSGDALPNLSFTGTYSKVKINAKPASETFVLKTVEGYKVEKDPEASELGIPSDERPKLKFAAGDVAPSFTLKNADGADVSLASLKGRVVLLDFWATWCGPCKMAMPGVQKLHEKYDGKKVSVFGVNTWERGSVEQRRDKATKYMASQKYTYGSLMGGDELAKSYGMSGIPTFVLIGPDGKILYLGVGFDEHQDETLANLIDKALDNKQ